MKDRDLMYVYLVTYDIGDNDSRYKINQFINLYSHCMLSETTYLVIGNDKFINEIHSVSIPYDEDDKFVIINMTNMEYIGHEKYKNECIKNILQASNKLFLLG